MKDKKIIIDSVDVSGCKNLMQGIVPFGCMEDKKTCSCMNNPNCIYKQLKRKENELEELRQYHNKCCEEFKKEKQDLIDKYNQLSRNFYNGDYCNTEHCSLLKSKEQECEELKKANDGILTTIRILAKSNIKLREVLTGIKDIAEPYCNACSEFEHGRGRHCKYCNYSKILQKISEV